MPVLRDKNEYFHDVLHKYPQRIISLLMRAAG